MCAQWRLGNCVLQTGLTITNPPYCRWLNGAIANVDRKHVPSFRLCVQVPASPWVISWVTYFSNRATSSERRSSRADIPTISSREYPYRVQAAVFASSTHNNPTSSIQRGIVLDSNNRSVNLSVVTSQGRGHDDRQSFGTRIKARVFWELWH
jgi:hypothetical protein